MNYYFPIHLDGGNRGCEAIARSSAILLNESADHIFGYTRDMDLDTRLGLSEYLTLIPAKYSSYIVDRMLGAINKLMHTPQTMKWRILYPYQRFLQMITPDDLVISTGGDMLCYDNNEVVYSSIWLCEHGVKTVLWGCSMGPENQTPEKLQTLFRYSLIYTRESLTYEYFQSLGLKNLCLLPDPAFILPAEECELPECLSGDNVVGLNISNYVMGGMRLDSPFGRVVLRLIEYILQSTNLHILLLPHVTWNDGSVNQDDRQMARLIYDYFGKSDRFDILDIDRMNYCQIRYAISKCQAFIGARTHAVISAYSMCVPTIALGYSVKSRGIAKDLGLDERLVVNSKKFAEGDLLCSFQYLMGNLGVIRNHLRKVMPEYSQRPYQIRKYLNEMF